MHDLLSSLNLIQMIIGIGIVTALFFYAVGYYGAWDFFGRAERVPQARPDATGLPAVTILKPLKGLDVDLYENLSTFCRQDYPRFQVVFGVADWMDPAVAVVRTLQAEHP